MQSGAQTGYYRTLIRCQPDAQFLRGALIALHHPGREGNSAHIPQIPENLRHFTYPLGTGPPVTGS